METCNWCGKVGASWTDEEGRDVCEECRHTLYAYCDTCERELLKEQLSGSPWGERRCDPCWDWYEEIKGLRTHSGR